MNVLKIGHILSKHWLIINLSTIFTLFSDTNPVHFFQLFQYAIKKCLNNHDLCKWATFTINASIIWPKVIQFFTNCKFVTLIAFISFNFCKMAFLFSKHCISKCNAEIVPNHTYPHISHWCNPLSWMQHRCLKFRLVTSCNNYLCLGLLAFYHLLHPGFFGRVWTWLLMLSCECTSVYRLNLIMHNYYSYALLTTFWCIYCTSTNIKPIIIMLNGEHQMSFWCNKKRMIILA